MSDGMAMAELAFVPWAVKYQGATIARFSDKWAAVNYVGSAITEETAAMIIVYDYNNFHTAPVKVQNAASDSDTPVYSSVGGAGA